MTVASTSNTTNATAGASQAKDVKAAPPNPKGEMGDEAFMKLLVEELKQQDPTNPMDAREMVTQLSQLSSVQKLQTIDDKLGGLQSSQLSSSAMQSAALIGHTVSAEANRLVQTGVGEPSGSYQLQNDAASVVIDITDSTGAKVNSLDAGTQGIGQKSFKWDGKDKNGARAPNGTYNFSVTAKDAAGSPVPVSTKISGVVSEVTYEKGAPSVVVNGASIALSDVTSVTQ